MEENKKNKIFIVSSCLIAVMVITFVIGIMPQMQLKSNQNVYQDTKSHGSIANCAESSSRCSYGNEMSGRCCTQVGVPMESCTGNYEVMFGSCYSCSGEPFEYCTLCDSGYHISGGQCVEDYDPVNYVSCCENGVYYSSIAEDRCNGQINITRAKCEEQNQQKTCYDASNNCAEVIVQGTSCGNYFALENRCLDEIDAKITCYNSRCNPEQISGRECPTGYSEDETECRSKLKTCWVPNNGHTACVEEQQVVDSCTYTSESECNSSPNIHCGEGQGILASGQGCSACPQGTYSDADDNECHTCTPSIISSQCPREISCCRKGADNKYSWSSGAGTAECASLVPADCAADGILNKGKDECDRMSAEASKNGVDGARYWWDEENNQCRELNCPAGYNADNGDCCITVGPGAYLDVAGGSNVISCPVDTYATGSNASRKYCLNDSSSDNNAAALSCQPCGSGKTSPIGSTSEADCVAPTHTCDFEIVTDAKIVSPETPGFSGWSNTNTTGHYADTFTVTIKAIGDGCNGKNLDLSTLGAECINNIKGTISNGQTFNIICHATTTCDRAEVSVNYAGHKTTESDKSVAVSTSSAWHKEAENQCVSLSDYEANYHSDVAADNNSECDAEGNCVTKNNPNKHYIVDGTRTPGQGKCSSDQREVDVWIRGCGGDTIDQTTTVDPTYACYANASDLNVATKAEWRTGKTAELPYKITYGPDKKTVITKDNYTTQCVASACYVENGTTNYKWATIGSLDASKYTKVDISKEVDCKDKPKDTPEESYACYVEKGTNKYIWAVVGSIDTSKYTEVDLKETECKDNPNVVESYACYADAANINDARSVKWQAKETTELPYKITVGADGKTKITKDNYSTQCILPKARYCYADNADLDKATQADLLTGPKDKLQYLIKDSNGNPITDKSLCVASACYIENGTTNYEWAIIGTLDASKYTKVEIYKKENCKDPSMCLVLESKDGKEFMWATSRTGENGIEDLIKRGYKPIESIKDEASCKAGGCYQKGEEFKWIPEGVETPEGYTKVEDEKCNSPIEPFTEEKCYVHNLTDGTVEYVWGHYSSSDYIEIDIPQKYCVTSKSCYWRKKDNTYHVGDYSRNPDYIQAADEASCKVVPAPKTALDRSSVMYVAMLFLAIAGVGLVYYGNYKRKSFN